MKEQLITFETAKLAKEKGFYELCDSAYSEDDKQIISKEHNNNYDFRNDSMSDEVEGYISAPTQSLLQKWLREKHNIDTFSQKCGQGYAYQIYKDFGTNKNITIPQKGWCDTYEQALEKGLQEALKLI